MYERYVAIGDNTTDPDGAGGVLSTPAAVGGSIRFAARPGFARWHSRPALGKSKGVLSTPAAVGGSIRFAARPGFAGWHSRPALGTSEGVRSMPAATDPKNRNAPFSFPVPLPYSLFSWP
jgi:hypothetical protein